MVWSGIFEYVDLSNNMWNIYVLSFTSNDNLKQ